MKRRLIPLLLAALAATALAANGTRVVLTTRAMPTLPPGTRVHVEMTAEYSVLQPTAPKPGSKRRAIEVTDDMIKYRLAAQGRAVWDFVVPPDGKVRAESFTFQFPKILPAAPNGMAAGITFPTHYRAVVPSSNGPVVIDRHSEFGMAYNAPAAVITRCIRISGSNAQNVGMGVVPDCDYDARKSGARIVPR